MPRTTIAPGSIGDRIARWPRLSFRLSVINLARAVGLLARVIVPIAVLSISGLVVLHLLYLHNPARTDGMRNLNVDHFVVLEQMKRAAALPAAEVAFLGDSSCLMGIDAPLIERALDLHPVESFCSIGYVGPVGYARMLAGMIERNAAPKTLVLVFHPATFRREPSWDFWTGFVSNGGKVEAPALHFPRSSLDFLQFEWLGRLIYNPLPGAYALYYGSERAFRSTIRARQGSAVDPNAGLNISSLAALHAVPSPPSGEPANFSWNEAYVDSLRVLGEAIVKLPHQTRVYLVISPVPDNLVPEGNLLERTERANQIAAALGIDADRILNTPETMFAAFFSSYTHLNRWGQKVFTGVLIKELADRR
jgi:hypothetical protein